jgi:hypothetical protein
MDLRAAPKFGFGSEMRDGMGQKHSAAFPGPGQYVPKKYTGAEGTSPSIHSKLEYKNIENFGGDTPGPGTYTQSFRNKKTAPAYGQGSSKRDTVGTSKL